MTPRIRRLTASAVAAGLIAIGATGIVIGTPAPADAAQVRIQTTTDLNVRSCPSTACSVIGVLRARQCVIAEAWAANRTWVRIQYLGARGFVSAQFVHRGCQP